jgi:NADPH:quinone reductase-like Zn-dependent oxidoreductase
VPCSDGVGTVEKVGEGVSLVREGDRVATLFSQGWMGGRPTIERLRATLGGPIDGTLSELMVLPEIGVIGVPEHLSDEAAATLPCAALTAWSALVELGEVTAGETVLVQGTGGVSVFALQLARLAGARVIVTSSSDDKLSRARELGAWQTINYREDASWGKTARSMTDGLGVDHVVDVGGAETLEQSLRAAGVGATVSVIGVLSGAAASLNIAGILMQNITLRGILVGSKERFERMNRAIANHRLEPVVDRIFTFADTPDAFAHMAAGRHFGKVCIAFE